MRARVGGGWAAGIDRAVRNLRVGLLGSEKPIEPIGFYGISNGKDLDGDLGGKVRVARYESLNDYCFRK